MTSLMSHSDLTPEESLSIISKTIEETRIPFQKKGKLFVAWGVLMFVVSIAQFILIKLSLFHYTGYVALLYPLAGVFSFVYVKRTSRKENQPKTHLSVISEAVALVVGLNLIVLALVFSLKLGQATMPIFFILLAIMILLNGVIIKFRPIILGGLFLNLLGFLSLLIDRDYHPLVLAVGSIFSVIIPGALLNKTK